MSECWTCTRPYLLISRIGGRSCHPGWLSGSARNFDLLLSGFDDRLPQGAPAEGIFVEHRPGAKVDGYRRLFAERRTFLSSYRYVALFDDDIETDAVTISRLFEKADAEGLKLCQPALTHNSYFTYGATLTQPAYDLRWVNFVEMMCPVFETSFLFETDFTFGLGYESGIDLIWCNLHGPRERHYAILDSLPVRHTRPVGSQKVLNGFTGERRYEDDIDLVLRRFGLAWLPCLPYAARRRDGRLVEGRLSLLLSALGILPAVPQRVGLVSRLRAILVHLKHLTSARPYNVAIGEAA